MPLINCEINLQLKWPQKCILVAGTAGNLITGTKLYVPVITLSTQDNVILLPEVESNFKRTTNWDKYQSKKINQVQNRYLDFLIDPSFQVVNRPFVLSFENEIDQKSYKKYYLPTVEIKNYDVMINRRIFFDQTVKNNLRTYYSIRKIAAGQCDGYTTVCLLDYLYFKKYYKLIAVDLNKQQKLDPDTKGIQQINFTGNVVNPGGTTMFFII